MNSAQRRRARREFPHVVLLNPAKSERYFQHDNRVDKARGWCRRQFVQGTWTSKELWDHAEFKFSNQKDAVYFALKWS